MSETPNPNPAQAAEPAAPAPSGWINWRQSGVLADRYMETLLADWLVTLLLLLQAPALAGMAVVVWGNIDSASQSLYFVMTLSCIWLGCIDACREIVKERALFLRERMFNLEVGAYLVSKLRVLALVNLVQVLSYATVLAYFLDIRVAFPWLVLNLLATTLAGTGLGLLISAAARHSHVAVGVVPLVILPQILFSEFAISKDSFEGVSEVIYTLMPSRWGYESLMEFAKTSPDYLRAFADLLPLFGFAVLFVLLAWPLLRFKRY